jgi:hypothetical protein
MGQIWDIGTKIVDFLLIENNFEMKKILHQLIEIAIFLSPLSPFVPFQKIQNKLIITNL